MKLTYVGKSDYRTISSTDFPDITFDFDEDVEAKEWVWVPGAILEVPEPVGEFLKVHHRQEFKVYEEPVEEVEATEDLTEPELTREERKVELEAMSRDELVDLAEGKELIVATSKTKKTELVDLLLNHYYSPDDEAIE